MQIDTLEEQIRKHLATRAKSYELIGEKFMLVVGRTLERLADRKRHLYVAQLIEFIQRASNDENEVNSLLSAAHFDPGDEYYPYIIPVEASVNDEIHLYAAAWLVMRGIEYVRRYRSLSAVTAVDLRFALDSVYAIRITSSENDITSAFFPVKCVLTYNSMASKVILIHSPDVFFTLAEERLSTNNLTITCSSIGDPDALMCIDYLGVIKLGDRYAPDEYPPRGFVRNCFQIQ